MNSEKEELYQNYLKVKDEEIKMLKEERSKKDQQMQVLRIKEKQNDKL